jgi:hypothetical protein
VIVLGVDRFKKLAIVGLGAKNGNSHGTLWGDDFYKHQPQTSAAYGIF